MKKILLAMLCVGLFLGTAFIVGIAPTTEVKGTASNYTFTVDLKYSDNGNAATNKEIKLEDLSTGSSCIKTTDQTGTVLFTPNIDLSSYSDGDILKITIPDGVAGYDSCIIEITGGSWLDGRIVHMFYFARGTGSTPTYNVGYMTLRDGTAKFSWNSPQTIYVSSPTQVVYFTATGSTSYSSTPSSYPNAAKVSVTYRLFVWSVVNGQRNKVVSQDQHNDVVDLPGNVDPLLTVYVNGIGTYEFKMQIDFQYLDSSGSAISQVFTGYSWSQDWAVKIH